MFTARLVCSLQIIKTMLKLVSQEVGLTRLGGLLAEAAVSSLD